MTPIKIVIGHHLAELRKAKGLTQGELAEEFGYTDKAVSKWEHGETMPDFDILQKLCDYYGITMAELVTEGSLADHQDNPQRRKLTTWTKLAIIGLSLMVVWLIAVLVFFVFQVLSTHFEGGFGYNWLVFLWAFPVSVIVSLVFNGIWGTPFIRTILNTLLVWSLIAVIYVSLGFLIQGGEGWGLWAIFFIGIPPTIAALLWYTLSKGSSKKRV